MSKKLHTPAQQDCPHVIVQLAELIKDLTREVALLELRVMKLENQIKRGSN